jgi:hypothetical protein
VDAHLAELIYQFGHSIYLPIFRLAGFVTHPGVFFFCLELNLFLVRVSIFFSLKFLTDGFRGFVVFIKFVILSSGRLSTLRSLLVPTVRFVSAILIAA